INSWIGDELRTIGGEVTVERRLESSTIGLVGAVYAWNEPTGALLADRGWAFDSRPIGLFGSVRLPDAMARTQRRAGPFWERPFTQMDSQPGWYAGASWRDDEIGRINILRYDNRADPSAKRDGVFAWNTTFTSAGFETALNDVVLLMQAM